MTDDFVWLIKKALEEDIGTGDITSNLTIPKDMTATAELIAKAEGVISGVDIAEQVFKTVDKNLDVKILLNNGSNVKPKNVIMKAKQSSLIIEVETTNLKEVQEALDVKADIIMLDNMTDEEMKKAVKLVNKKAKLEASGNMNLERVKKIANIGLDFISVGAITHSAPNLDLSLEIVMDD